MIKSVLCEMLGIRYPIFQGGMAHVSKWELVVAVSEAGALGILGAGGMTPEELHEQIREVKKRTDKPFGVNLMLMHPEIDRQVEVVLEEEVPVVTTGAGNPGKYIKAFKERGIRVFPVVASVALARRLERIGVDGLIAEGTESGGHVGELTTLVLVPQIVDAVKIPVIAAGGIADGRGMAAAFALGAVGVQMGTRFVASTEAPIHESYKRRIVSAGDRDTVVTGKWTGHPVRIIKNKLARIFLEMERKCEPPEKLEELGRGALRRAVEGDVNMGSVMAGQISGLIKDIKPVKEIIEGIVAEAEETIRKLQGVIAP